MSLIFEDVFFQDGNITFNPSKIDSNGLKTQKGIYNTKLSKTNGIIYFKAYQFHKDLDKDTRVSIQKAIKAGTLDAKSMLILVSKSIILFNKLLPISKFDVIVAPESSAMLNKMIMAFFKNKYPHLEIIPAGFIKRLGKDVTLKQDLIDKLKDKTKKSVQSNLSKTLSADDWKMKGIYQPNKKFLDRVLWPTDQLNVQGKRVLVIDDVITEGTTLKDMIRICNEHGSKFTAGYIFMSEK